MKGNSASLQQNWK